MFNGKIFGSGHAHLDHQTSLVRNDADPPPTMSYRTESGCLSILSLTPHPHLENNETPQINWLRVKQMNVYECQINNCYIFVCGCQIKCTYISDNMQQAPWKLPVWLRRSGIRVHLRSLAPLCLLYRIYPLKKNIKNPSTTSPVTPFLLIKKQNNIRLFTLHHKVSLSFGISQIHHHHHRKPPKNQTTFPPTLPNNRIGSWSLSCNIFGSTWLKGRPLTRNTPLPRLQ